MLLPVQGTPQAQIAWEALRLSGADSLAVRVSRKLRSDELYLTTFASTRLRMELERVPLWRGDHVAVKLLVEDFARYLYRKRSAHPPLGAHNQTGFLSGRSSSMRRFGQEGSFSRVSVSQAMGSMPFARAVSSSD